MLVMVTLLGPALWQVDPEAQDLVNRLTPPWGLGGTSAHPLGTDSLGRDTMARLISGARVSLPLSVAATLASGAIGITLGVLAGYGGGWIDRAVTWLSDVQLAIPFVVFAIAVTAVFGNSVGNVLVDLDRHRLGGVREGDAIASAIATRGGMGAFGESGWPDTGACGGQASAAESHGASSGAGDAASGRDDSL